MAVIRHPAMVRYLAVLAVMLSCLAGDANAVTDQEFQDLSKLVLDMNAEIQAQGSLIGQLQDENKHLSHIVESQASDITDLKELLKRVLKPSEAIEKPFDAEIHFEILNDSPEMVQNVSIEERVALLEIQVADLDQDVNFLFDEQVIQDERLLTLEQDSDQIEDDVESLQDLTLALDFRVTALEENGGSGGNSSISELEERVETLEGTAADHETRLSSAESEIEDLEGTSDDHETRLTAAEETIQGLQMTDISLDARITALEENGGGGGSQNGTVAFHAVRTSYSTIPEEATVVFDEILLNEGDGYDSTTGIFTVPDGGNGWYYFATYLTVDHTEFAYFDIMINDETVCTAYGNHANIEVDWAHTSCSAAVYVAEGDEVQIVNSWSSDDSPLYLDSSYLLNGFNGFRI